MRKDMAAGVLIFVPIWVVVGVKDGWELGVAGAVITACVLVGVCLLVED